MNTKLSTLRTISIHRNVQVPALYAIVDLYPCFRVYRITDSSLHRVERLAITKKTFHYTNCLAQHCLANEYKF